MKKNIIFICVDGGRADRAINSQTLQNFQRKNSIFFSQIITYAPYTNSALHAMISGSYGNDDFIEQAKKYTSKKKKHDDGYYTCADVPSDLIMPRKNYDEYYVSDESEIDLRSHHSDLLNKMKSKFDDDQPFFLHLHYSGIHEGIRDSVLKSFTIISPEFFENKKQNEDRYDV